jgi:hypothetical protein
MTIKITITYDSTANEYQWQIDTPHETIGSLIAFTTEREALLGAARELTHYANG